MSIDSEAAEPYPSRITFEHTKMHERKCEKGSLLVERVRSTIESKRLFGPGMSILVAVSGGMDSTVLLHILRELAPEHGWQLTVAHLNHRLRGRSSDADERLVRSVCKEFGLPLFVERFDVRKRARHEKLSIEMAARKARQEFLARVAAKKQISTIALAHHADDQVELFFIRLLRGASGEGLAGMKWRNALPSAKHVQITRPLLGETKSTLREYAVAQKINYREDATNASLDIFRNRIRHELLPFLKRRYQPALNQVVMRLMQIVGEEADLAKLMAQQWTTQSRKEKQTSGTQQFSELPVAVQRRCLQMQLLAKGMEPTFELIEQLRLKANVAVTFDVSRSVFQDGNGLLRSSTSELIQFDEESQTVCLDNSSNAVLKGIEIAWLVQPTARVKLPKRKPGTEYFDAEMVGTHVTLRHWQKGDRFQPIGMPRAVKLQDLFVNQRVPRALRHKLLLAATENGEIFWVEGFRISERFKLTKATKRRLQWRWKRD